MCTRCIQGVYGVYTGCVQGLYRGKLQFYTVLRRFTPVLDSVFYGEPHRLFNIIPGPRRYTGDVELVEIKPVKRCNTV